MPKTTNPAAEELAADVCWDLLSAAGVARLAVATAGGVDIFPVNFLIKDRTIYFRSAPGSKLAEIAGHPSVAFEADGVFQRRRWSVVVKGVAERLAFDTEIEDSGVLDLATYDPSEKWNYIRITPESITGRRFTTRRRSSQ